MVKNNVCIFSKNSKESLQLIDFLDKIGNENGITFVCSVFSDTAGIEDMVKGREINLVIADMELARENGFELNIIFRNHPLVIIVEPDIEFLYLEESMMKGSSGFVERPLAYGKIESTMKPIIKKLRYVDSYSNSIINALLEFFSTEDIANRMTSVAKIACTKFKIDDKTSADIFRVLKILSVAIKTNSLIKTMRLFDQLRVAKRLIEILNHSIIPKDTVSNIIHLIYFFELMRHRNKPFSEFKCETCDLDVYRDILLIFNKKEILIESGMDLENIWTELLESVNHAGIPIDEADSFIAHSIKITKRILVYYQGGVARILRNDAYIEFQIQPEYIDEMLMGWVERLSMEASDISNEYTLKISQEDDYVSVKLVNLQKASSQAIDDSFELFLDMDTVLDDDPLKVRNEFKDGDKRVKVSALEFFHTIEDLEDIEGYMDSLKLLEEDIEETLTKKSALTTESLVGASEIFSKYGSFLGSLDEFRELSYAIFTLSSVLRSCNIQELEKNEKKVYRFLTSVIDDLVEWKKNIFITKEAVDIHYLDDSLLSSCAQLEALINQSSSRESIEDSEDDELELF